MKKKRLLIFALLGLIIGAGVGFAYYKMKKSKTALPQNALANIKIESKTMPAIYQEMVEKSPLFTESPDAPSAIAVPKFPVKTVALSETLFTVKEESAEPTNKTYFLSTGLYPSMSTRIALFCAAKEIKGENKIMIIINNFLNIFKICASLCIV